MLATLRGPFKRQNKKNKIDWDVEAEMHNYNNKEPGSKGGPVWCQVNTNEGNIAAKIPICV